MRQSKLFTKARKEAPKDEVSKNAQLLIRGGFIHKEMAGVYSMLPLGLRVLNKIANIIREEMNAIGGVEFHLSILQDKQIWQKSDRWNDEKVDNWFKSSLKNGTEVGLGFTHEEPLSNVLKEHVSSYRDLPVYTYQIQTKFRNEERAKSGLMRGREFLMKDSYSFCKDEKEQGEWYEKSKKAYVKIFERLGLGEKTHLTFASGGSFSKYSHEFQTETAAGEDLIFYDEKEKIYYNREIVPSQAPEVQHKENEQEMEDVLGEGLIGVEPLAEFLKIPVEKTTKTLLYENENGEKIAAAVRGNYQVNEIKLKEVTGSEELNLVSEKQIKELTGAEVGYVGMLNLPKEVRQVWDESTKNRVNFEMGANKTNYHTINVNFSRDIEEPKEYFDIKVAEEGDLNPNTGKPYKTLKTVEVGNIFNLGTRFSEAEDLFYLDEKGKKQKVWMGSYGIGVGRVMATIAEVFADENGLVWPENVAPFKFHLVALDVEKNEEVKKTADEIYKMMQGNSIEVLLDDRDMSAGEKFAESDLLGIPYRMVISEKNLKEGLLEIKDRRTGEVKKVDKDKTLRSLFDVKES